MGRVLDLELTLTFAQYSQFAHANYAHDARANDIYFFIVVISFKTYTFIFVLFYFFVISWPPPPSIFSFIYLGRLLRYVFFIRPEGLRLQRRLKGRLPTGKRLI